MSSYRNPDTVTQLPYRTCSCRGRWRRLSGRRWCAASGEVSPRRPRSPAPGKGYGDYFDECELLDMTRIFASLMRHETSKNQEIGKLWVNSFATIQFHYLHHTRYINWALEALFYITSKCNAKSPAFFPATRVIIVPSQFQINRYSPNPMVLTYPQSTVPASTRDTAGRLRRQRPWGSTTTGTTATPSGVDRQSINQIINKSIPQVTNYWKIFLSLKGAYC